MYEHNHGLESMSTKVRV